ncbi:MULTISPECIES: hypothetical protein [unclassified Nostoc]|uniref:hypothetical protein n=1 Tax=unclassified Nostoc TaxID=2593658 RepID=UPI00262125B8|nr:hypothetical protein [Nostoc sp. S13]
MLQGRPFIMQLKTTSQQLDLKASLSQAERYGHHLDKIQCAISTTPIQMLSTDEEEKKKLASGMDIETNKFTSNKKVLEKVLSVGNGLKTFNNQKDRNIEPKKHFAEKTESATESSKSKDKDKKQNSDEHLTSPTTNKISEKEATAESSPHHDPEVTKLLNKPTQSNLAGSGGIQQNNQEKFMPPPSTYNEHKNTTSTNVGSRGQYLAKREAMDMLGDRKGFATIQRAVNIPLTNTHKSKTSKAEDSKQQVKLKNAAELVRDQVINEDRQVKEHVQAKLDLDPAIVAKQGGEQLILQKMQ